MIIVITKSVGLLWTRDRPVSDTSAWEHKKTEFDAAGGIRTRNPREQEATCLLLRPRGNVYRLLGTTSSNLNWPTN